MGVTDPVLAAAGLLASVVVTLVDGRNAPSWAAVAAGAGLAPSVASAYGADGTVLLLVAALVAAVTGPLTRAIARRISWMPGVDPVVPIVAGSEALFGPRSIRVAGSILVLPAASWVSSNVPVGATSTVRGVLFPAAVVWGCAGMRLLTARALVDLAVGVAGIGLASASAWLLSGSADPLSTATVAASLAPGAAITAGWLSGRHADVLARHGTAG